MNTQGGRRREPRFTNPGSRLLRLYAFCVFAFLYFPIAVLVIYSFNGVMLFVAASMKLSLVTITLGHGTALIAVSFFLIGRDNTLPLEIWSRLRRGMTPEINAISTLIFAFSLISILVWYRLRTRSEVLEQAM